MSAELVLLDLPATYRHLSILGACLAELLGRVEGLADRELLVYNIQLAAHEVATNIVEHAYAGREDGRIAVRITLDGPPRRLTVELSDTGRPFDLTGVADPDLEQLHEHGYGLFLVRSLMDEVTCEPAGGGNRWRLVKQL